MQLVHKATPLGPYFNFIKIKQHSYTVIINKVLLKNYVTHINIEDEAIER